MLLQAAKQDVVANNIANVNTYGYKKDVVACQAFPQMLLKRIGELKVADGTSKSLPPKTIGYLGTGAAVAEIATDYSPGNLQRTDNPLDLALGGEGYFVVETPAGARYTRDGSFKLNDEGLLVTSEGYPVLGRAGYIHVTQGEVVVDQRGNVSAGGEFLDSLRVVKFPTPDSPVKTGGNLFSAEHQTVEDVPNPEVLQGCLEASNVNVVKEMVELITVVRAYEANQKVIQAFDQTLDAAVNRVGPL